MFEDKKILGLITARGGSKGLPRKNIRILGDKPLIGWTIGAGLKSKYIDRLVVTSEDEEILEVSKTYGADVPFVRPAYLAKDDTSSVDTVLHAIENIKGKYDYLILLQPTSPFRDEKDIDGAIEKFFSQEDPKSLISMVELENPIQWNRTIGKDGYIKKVVDYDNKHEYRRQDFDQVFRFNGAIYLIEIESFIRYESFELPSTIPYIMDGPSSIDIDNFDDFRFAEFILGTHKKSE